MFALKLLAQALLLSGATWGFGVALLPRQLRGQFLGTALAFALGFAAIAVFSAANYAWSFDPTVVRLFLGCGLALGVYSLLRRSLAIAPYLPLVVALGHATLLVILLRNFLGLHWYGDWFEHYERTLFFLQHWPLDRQFLAPANYSLPARPPLFHLLLSPFLQVCGESFLNFQWQAFWLNALALLALAAVFVELGGKRFGWLALFAATNPMLLNNLTYPWPRMLTAFFILTALALEIRAVRSQASGCSKWAFFCLGLAMLTHYSAAPYLVALAASHLWRRKTFSAGLAIGPAFCCLIPWWAWTAWNFGLSGTFLSNTAITHATEFSAFENLWKILAHFGLTFFPLALPTLTTSYSSPFAVLHQTSFMLYQMNLAFTLGLAGLGCMALRPAGSLRALLTPVSSARPALLASAALVLGIAVVGGYEKYGVAHVCLQPLSLVFLVLVALLASQLSASRRNFVVSLCALDLLFGVWLHFAEQRYNLTGGNFQLKQQQHLKFIGDEIKF